MSQSPEERDLEFYAETYDEAVPDWPGEIDFYSAMAAEVALLGEATLEIACGTGRVAIRLATAGVNVVGLDLSPRMLEVARRKSAGMTNIHWVQADMRSFELDQKFGLVLVPGHAFQNLNTARDQVACLECIKRHLTGAGTLVIHLDHPEISWLGDLTRELGGVFEAAEKFQHPKSKRPIHAFRAWSYEPASQSAICRSRWEEIGEDGQVVDQWQANPSRLHCVFPFEMEHLLGRVGYTAVKVYGDFFKNDFQDSSSSMIWVARCK